MSGTDLPTDKNESTVSASVAETSLEIPETEMNDAASSDSLETHATVTSASDLKSWRFSLISGIVFLGWVIPVCWLDWCNSRGPNAS